MTKTGFQALTGTGMHLGEYAWSAPLRAEHHIVPRLVPEIIPKLGHLVCPCPLHLQYITEHQRRGSGLPETAI